jgi:hypothetical protein
MKQKLPLEVAETLDGLQHVHVPSAKSDTN